MKRIVFATICCIMAACLTQCNSAQSVDNTTDTTAADTLGSTANFKIGIQMWTFNKFTFIQALDKVDSAGIKNIEAFWGQTLGGDMKGEFGIGMSPDTRNQLKQLLQSKGISITAMGVIAPDNNTDWLKAFELAKEFGLSYITAEPTKAQWDYIDSLAGVFSIKVAIHDHPIPSHYWSPDSVLEASNGHPNIGSCADIGHWARNGLDPVECLKKLEGHVYGVHFKDVVTFNKVDAADTVVGKGVINIAAVLQELKRQQFSGMLSIEHESNWDHNLPDVIEIIQFYNDQLGKLK